MCRLKRLVEIHKEKRKSSRWNLEKLETTCLCQIRQDLISRMDDNRSKVLNAHQGEFESEWLNVVPCKNLGLELDDQLNWFTSRSQHLCCAYAPLL